MRTCWYLADFTVNHDQVCHGSVFLSFFHPNQADFCHTMATVPITPWYTGHAPKRQTKKKIHSTVGRSSRERETVLNAICQNIFKSSVWPSG